MKRRLPSLIAVRYFEAVGRNLSFTLAANELNVTQAAVSHQVRLLEEDIGVKFFNRFHQRIELTPEGIHLLNVATECLDRLADTFDGLSGRDRTERIHLCLTPYISSRWLMPKLDEYLDNKDNIEIIFHHSLVPPSDRDLKFDLKIFFTTTPTEDPAYEYLFSDTLVPLCAPSLIKDFPDMPVRELLYRVKIAHELSYEWWGQWCRAAGIDEKTIERGNVIDDPTVLENSALLGHGMILGSRLFLGDRIARGELLVPAGAEHAINIHYYVYVRPQQKSRQVSDFRKWLIYISKATKDTN